MTFRDGLVHARSHIVFIVGLLTASGLVLYLENLNPGAQRATYAEIESSGPFDVPDPRALDDTELEYASIAWRYFENNTDETTGLVRSVDGYDASTMWDTASYLMGLIAAHRLDLVDDEEIDWRLARALDSLASLPLFDDQLPHKVYNTHTLDMVDYTNQPTERGIGWSSIDIGRLLVPFNVLVWQYPHHADAVRQVIAQWDPTHLAVDGVLYGAAVSDSGETIYLQEGRLGYEEYSCKSFSLMGLDASRSAEIFDYLEWIEIDGVDVATDSRDPMIYDAHNYVVSEPYILDGVEFGWDRHSRELARRVYDAQVGRYERTGQLTAVSEDNIDQAPYFVYNTVFSDGEKWNAITEEGEDASEFRTISTKAAIGWHMLYETDYTTELMAAVAELHDPEKGWYSGRYEATGEPNRAITCNTNAIVLECLAYREHGPLTTIRTAQSKAIQLSEREN